MVTTRLIRCTVLALLTVAFGLLSACASPQTSLSISSALPALSARSSAPLAAPTGTPGPSTLPALTNALTKTAAATVLRMTEAITASLSLMGIPGAAGDTPVLLLRVETQVNGKDSHSLAQGFLASFLGADPDKGLETIVVGGQTYVHGPLPLLDAPEDQWYLLDSSSGTLTMGDPVEQLQKISTAGGDWSLYKLLRKGDTFDGQACDVYGTGQQEGADAVKTVLGIPDDPSSPGSGLDVDSAAMEIAVCADGYVHSVTANLTSHSSTTPTTSSRADIVIRLRDFGGNIVIAAPDKFVKPTPSDVTVTTRATETRSPATPGATTLYAYVGYDGEWEGETADGSSISFEISDNRLTYVNLAYSVRSGNCYLSGSYSATPQQAEIATRGFAIQLNDSDRKQYDFSGTFSSATQVSGTLSVKGTTESCGPIDFQSTWTAARTLPTPTPAPRRDTPPLLQTPTPTYTRAATLARTPTRAPTPLPKADVSVVLAGLVDALNKRDVDTALTFFGEDPLVDWGTETSMDLEELRTLLTNLVKRNVTYEISNVQSVGGTIAYFTLKEIGTGGKSHTNSNAITGDGKIEILGIQ